MYPAARVCWRECRLWGGGGKGGDMAEVVWFLGDPYVHCFTVAGRIFTVCFLFISCQSEQQWPHPEH